MALLAGHAQLAVAVASPLESLELLLDQPPRGGFNELIFLVQLLLNLEVNMFKREFAIKMKLGTSLQSTGNMFSSLPHTGDGRMRSSLRACSGLVLCMATTLALALPGQASQKLSGGGALPKGTGTPTQISPSKAPPPIVAASSYLVRVSRFNVNAGDKPGDTATLSMTIETSGSGVKDIPWIFSNGTAVIASGIERGVGAGKSVDVWATYRLPPTEGVLRLQGSIDPKNTLFEPDGERANNFTQVVEKALKNPIQASTGLASISKRDTTATTTTPTTTTPTGSLLNSGIKAVSGPDTGSVKADLKQNSVTSVSLDANVFRGSSVQGSVTLESPARVMGLTVNLTSSSPALGVPASVTVPGGSTTASFTAVASASAQPGSVVVSALIPGAGGVPKQATVTVSGVEQVRSLTKVGGVCPRNILDGGANRNLWAGDRCLLKVELENPAGQAGARAILSSSSSAVTIPASVNFPALGGTSPFDVTVSPNAMPGPITITATGDRPGAVSRHITLMIDAAPASKITDLGLPQAAEQGVALTGRIQLDRQAEPGGINVALRSSNFAVTVPTNVNIPAGARSATFTAQVAEKVPMADVVITGTRSGQGNVPVTHTLKLRPIQVSSLLSLGEMGSRPLFAMSGVPLLVGNPTSIKVELDGVAISNVPVNLKSSNSAVVVPASITVVAGQTSTTFIATSAPGANSGDAIISAWRAVTGNAKQNTVKQYAVSLVPIQPKLLSIANSHLTWSATAPVTTQATLTLSGPAPTGGLSVIIECGIWPMYGPVMDCLRDNAVSVPSNIHVPAGQTTATFSVTLGTQRPAARTTGTSSEVMLHAYLPHVVDYFASRPGISIMWP